MNYSTPIFTDVLALNLIKAGDYYKNENLKYAGSISGALSYYSLSNAIHDDGKIVANNIWNLGSSCANTFTGLLIWDEKLSSRKLIGVVVALVAIYLLDGEN